MERIRKKQFVLKKISFLEVLLVLIPFIQIRTYQETPIIGWIYFFASIISSLYIFGKLGNTFFHLFEKTYTKLLSLFIFFYILPSLIYFKMGYIISICRIISLYALFLYLCYASRISVKIVLRALSAIYSTLIIANFIIFILIPVGLYKVTKSTHHSALLLGDDNALAYVFLPGLTCMICYSLQKYGKINMITWFSIFSSIYTLFAVWSISAMVCISIFLLCILLLIIGIKIKSNYYFFTIVGVITIVLFGLSIPQVQGFIENVLQKDVTLTGRTILWQLAFKDIISKPLLGYGGYFIQGRYDLSLTSTYPCHTQYLQMLLDGGIMLFACYCCFVFYLFMTSKDYFKVASANVLIIGLTCMMINYITEYSMHYHFIIIAALICNLNCFKKDVVKSFL